MSAADRLLLFSLSLFFATDPRRQKKPEKGKGGKRVDGDKLRFKAPCKRFGEATPKREEDVSIEEHKRAGGEKGKRISLPPLFFQKNEKWYPGGRGLFKVRWIWGGGTMFHIIFQLLWGISFYLNVLKCEEIPQTFFKKSLSCLVRLMTLPMNGKRGGGIFWLPEFPLPLSSRVMQASQHER